MCDTYRSEATRRTGRPTGFSLIELVIVVVIIGIIGAIAIPRISRGASGAADSALVANLAVLRNAIDLYATEHQGAYPTLTNIENQLKLYTDIAGDASAKDATHIYGPYLRAIPPLPVGPAAVKGQTAFVAALDEDEAAGWVYDASTGTITANTNDTDAAGKAYNTY